MVSTTGALETTNAEGTHGDRLDDRAAAVLADDAMRQNRPDLTFEIVGHQEE
ncbi:hypothetical protein [Georgenia halophila]|uniref:hypothetical protein n=1 Tax=Georgenia halophila TaxID=620889 RepID=UPI0031EB06AC